MKKQINIILTKDSKIYNQFNNSQLSDELHNYIYNQFRGESLKNDVELIVQHNFEMTDEEKNKLVDEIREDYGIDIRENILKLKLECFKQIIFMIIGVLLLLLSSYLIKVHADLAGQIFTIFAWVIIYEFVYSFVFFNVKTRIENKRFKKIIAAKISFNQTS